MKLIVIIVINYILVIKLVVWKVFVHELEIKMVQERSRIDHVNLELRTA